MEGHDRRGTAARRGRRCLTGSSDRRRRARRPGPADATRARADRRGRRDPLRPPDPAGALDGARADAELVYVGKDPRRRTRCRRRTSTRCSSAARAGQDGRAAEGRRPVRVRPRRRGGRGAARGRRRFEVVPGITAGIAAPGLRRHPRHPPRRRQRASRSSPATRTRTKPGSAIDWDALARFPGTLVFYMGVKALPRIAEALIEGGRAPDEPAAVVERGTLAGPAHGHHHPG